MRKVEEGVQRAIVTYLGWVVPHGLVFAIPNAAVRAHRYARAGNAVPGLYKGFPDLGLIVDRVTYFFECKAPGGRTSSDQISCHIKLAACGVRCAVVEDVEQVRLALAAWGVKTREARAA